MLKIFMRVSIFLCFAVLQANDEVLLYIPAKSVIHRYCQNSYTQDTETIKELLERMENSKKHKHEIDQIERQINNYQEKFNELKENLPILQVKIKEYEQYFAQEKLKYEAETAILQVKKANLERQHLPLNFPKEGSQEDIDKFDKALSSILGETRAHGEKEYLAQAFANAYENQRPWNTYTINEKVLTIVVVGCAATFSFAFAWAH